MRLDDGKFGKFSVRLDLERPYTLRKRVRGDPGLPGTPNGRRLIFNRRPSAAIWRMSANMVQSVQAGAGREARPIRTKNLFHPRAN